MLLNRIYYENDIIGAALQGLALRNDIIQHNIANAELANYKKSDVLFEQSLQNVVKDYKRKDEINIGKFMPQVVKNNKNLSYRLDGNNVDMESEMSYLYQTDAKYQTLASAVINNYKRINMVLTSK